MIEIPTAAYITMIVIDTVIFMIFINVAVVRLIIWAKEKAAKLNYKKEKEND